MKSDYIEIRGSFVKCSSVSFVGKVKNDYCKVYFDYLLDGEEFIISDKCIDSIDIDGCKVKEKEKCKKFIELKNEIESDREYMVSSIIGGVNTGSFICKSCGAKLKKHKCEYCE